MKQHEERMCLSSTDGAIVVLLWPDVFVLVPNMQTHMAIKSVCAAAAACELAWAHCFKPNKVMLPCTWVWYTTKKSLFPQLSKSSPTHRWRHSSSSSCSCRVKRGVGNPQWHFSPAKAARENSYARQRKRSYNTDSYKHSSMRDTRFTSCIHTYFLCAHVNTLVHRHVLNNSTSRKRQRHVVWPLETTFEDGTPILRAK